MRWAHIFAGTYLGIYVLSPLRLDQTATIAAQAVIVGLTLSGLALWQLPRLMRWARG